MAQGQGLLSSAWSRVSHNKRYIVWFYSLNVALAGLGAVAFSNQASDFLDHSLLSDRLLHGFDFAVLLEMLYQPGFGTIQAAHAAGLCFALLFFVLTALFLPGVLQGYAATYRLPREDFFRACGRNLWRFIRLMMVAGIVMGGVAWALFALHGMVERQAMESTNELLLPEVRFAGLVVIFLVMASLRIAFDLAEVDAVLSDQRAVRKSIVLAFRHVWSNFGRLLGSYVVTTIVAMATLAVGLWAWLRLVPAASVHGALFVSQLTLFLLLIPRFWQRGIVVSYYLQNMTEPIVVQPFTPMPVIVSE
jgi:hypothetical protein